MATRGHVYSWLWLVGLVFFPMKYGWVSVDRLQPSLVRRKVFEVDEATSLIARPKKELVDMCRQAQIKVSGTKAELVERLLASQYTEEEVSVVVPEITTIAEDSLGTEVKKPEFSGRRETELAEAAIDLLVTEVAASGAPERTDPRILAAKTDALLAEGGAVFERVRKRRLAVSNDPILRGTFALLQGFVAGHQRTRSRDAVRYMLRAATESSEAIDRAFEALRDAKKLDQPLQDYVENLLMDKKLRSGPDGLTDTPSQDTDDLLTRVLLILSDRIKAELQIETQATDPDCFRTLARAIQLPKDRREQFLKDALSTSLDFALRFQEYVNDALAYVEDQEQQYPPAAADSVSSFFSTSKAQNMQQPSLSREQCEAIRDLQRTVAQIRAGMPL